jgi:phage FluMu protein gp41
MSRAAAAAPAAPAVAVAKACLPGALRMEGELLTGIELGGEVHKRFTLRLPTLGDNVAAVDEVGSDNGVALNAAILARQLTELGTLSPEQISYELLCELHPADYNILDAAASALEKKRQAAAQPLAAEELAQTGQPSA